MALIMNDEQRAEALKEYNPKERLIQVGKDKQSGKAVLYYPAAWRLYELHLRYPNANFKSEIVYHDEQKGTVIVKAYLYLGKNYDESDKKAEAMKQGSIASLDKVETAAKARCARDFGIGTEYALDMVADETDATHDTTPAPRQNGHQGGAPVESLKPSEVDGLKSYVGKVFKFKQEDFDTRWLAYKKFRLNRQVDDMSLTLLDATTLRDFAEKEEAKNGAVTQAN